MKKKVRPQFFAIEKDFNDGKLKSYDVLNYVFNRILTDRGAIRNDFYVWDKDFKRIPVRTKEQCAEFVEQVLRNMFWGRCEWEFVAIDWPYGSTIDKSRPVKLDVFGQLKPNLPVIVDLVWNYIEDKVQKLVEKEKNPVKAKKIVNTL